MENIPVVTVEEIPAIFKSRGIQKWPTIRPPVALDEYRNSPLTEEARTELRFSPKADVVFLQQPNGEEFRGFRSRISPWALVFALLPDRTVIVIVEYKHGADEITFTLPGGLKEKEDDAFPDPFAICAKREFEEEVGLRLSRVHRLSPGMLVSGRNITALAHPFVGFVEEPLRWQAKALDVGESLMAIRLSLPELFKLFHAMPGVEQCAIATSFLALNYLQEIAE